MASALIQSILFNVLESVANNAWFYKQCSLLTTSWNLHLNGPSTLFADLQSQKKKEKNLPSLCTLHLVQALMSVFQCFLQDAKKEEQKQLLWMHLVVIKTKHKSKKVHKLWMIWQLE